MLTWHWWLTETFVIFAKTGSYQLGLISSPSDTVVIWIPSITPALTLKFAKKGLECLTLCALCRCGKAFHLKFGSPRVFLFIRCMYLCQWRVHWSVEDNVCWVKCIFFLIYCFFQYYYYYEVFHPDNYITYMTRVRKSVFTSPRWLK